jgi:hypothetical protein
MLVGYVSNEQYVAQGDVLVEIHQGEQSVAALRSTATGALYADIEPGTYRVTLVKAGFGSKRCQVTVQDGTPWQFRLLSDRLVGFMWPKWVRAGDRAEHRVHSVEPFRLALWRYGLRRELVRLVGWFDEHGPRAVMQITPDGDYTQAGVGWNKVGYGNPNQSQLMVAPERTGLYYLHAKTATGQFFSFPWVVAPAAPTARVAVIASSNSWNAYNDFGGRSNYVNPTGLPPEPTVNARQDLDRYAARVAYSVWRFPDDQYPPLSFERPELSNHIPEDVEVADPIAGRMPAHMAPAEWRLLGWLERERVAYDVYADAQLHDGTLELDAYRVLIASVHPEYWTRRMYERVKSWVHERGGRFMYLGGNGLNCEVEFLGERDTDNQALRCRTYLGSVEGSLGMPDPANPSRWLESRFHRTTGESEASLLGVVTTESGLMTGAPYRVLDAAHWAFEGSGLKNGDVFGTASLNERVPGGASGYETDKMSPSSPPGTHLLAKGLNPNEGGAEMTCYELDGGGGVFSAGSITYTASLLVDEGVSRVTANVIRRFLT